ncbi:uncharacterized protein [Lepeophtheirus salmonis]|uniref:uncharacterized protein isoform X1 n=2 Tax=Lepeophtheirus salmonis TaxID=72036 RepID=UPI001AEB53D5|nr:uncharacterized protein DDB_G0286591-like isoform X1 [Lepeophtheirus salmonis]
MLTKLYLSYYIFFSLIIKQGIAYRHYYLTPLLTRNNVLCSAEVVQNQGKYFCDQDLNIRCVPGWRSEKSLCEFPICPEECNADKRQGKCILPSICACAVGWKGFSCNECIPRQGCARGYCENPGDCICHEHFSGPLCNQINVDESFIPFGVDQHQNQIMENHVKSDIISKEVLEESTSIRTMNDTSSNTANNSKNSSESEITFKQIIQNSVMNKNPKKIKSLQDTDLSIENSVLSMSESQSTNRSSFEDFTAPAKHRSKMILNSTAKIFESPPSMFDEVEEDTTTINELERNVKSSSSNQDSSEQISEQKVDVAPRFKSDEDSEKYLPAIGNMEMGPRFGGFYEDYSDFSIDQDTLAKLNAESSKTMENMMDRHKEMINGKSNSTKKTMEKNETSKENMPEVNESSENNRGVIGNGKSLLKGSDKETNEPQVMKRNLSSGDSLNNKINSTTRSILKSSSGESNSHSKNRGNTNESQTHNDPTFVDINRPHIRGKEISHNYQRKNLTNSQNNVKNMSNHSSLTSRIQNKGSIDLNKIDGSYKNNDIDKKTAKKPTTSILKPERGIFIKPLNDTNSKNSRLKKNDLYMQTSTPKSDSMRQNERSNKILKDKLSHAKDKNGTMNQTYAGKTEHSKKNIAIIEESQIDSPSTSYKKMNNSIENIEGVLNNLSSVEQRTNHTYITSSDNVSYSINHSGKVD